jgi:hypothetical protein
MAKLKSEAAEGNLSGRREAENIENRGESEGLGIVGISVIVHLEGKEDLVTKVDLTGA